MHQTKTISEFVGERFRALIDRGEQIGEFELRRLEVDVRKLPDEFEKSMDMAYLMALWGRYDEATNWLRSTGGFGPSTALWYAGAAQASLQFHEARKALRCAIDAHFLDTAERRRQALVVAAFSCSFNVCREILSLMESEDEAFDIGASNEAMQICDSLGLKDEYVQEYVMRSLKAVDKWLYDKRRPMVIGHATSDQMPDKILINLNIPAEAEEFGDIMWAASDIDRAGIPDNVCDSVIIVTEPAGSAVFGELNDEA
ncbi:hypothetical protein GY26_01810 [Gammaproteobacteria bacterium MFB021]|nr:hypothetical protein GY26_01810 [Gammaproteobacteria bacterium MFB021]